MLYQIIQLHDCPSYANSKNVLVNILWEAA